MITEKAIEKLNEFNNTENTKYSTVNGIKEFECSRDRYLSNININGETLINLSKIGSRSWNTSSNDAIRTRFVDKYAHTFNDRITDGIFTCFNYTDKRISFVHYTKTGEFVTRSRVEPYSSKLYTLDENTSIIGIDFWLSDGWLQSELDTVDSSMFMILEGDYTNRNIPYFEGTKSIGQNNGIEVMTRLEDGNILSCNIELGALNDDTGENLTHTKCIRSKDYIRVKPSSTIYFYNDKGYARNIYYYDINKKFIGWSGASNANNLPEKCYYIRFRSNIGSSQNDTSVKYCLSYSNILSYIEPKYNKRHISWIGRSIGNINDLIYEDNGKYYTVKKCEQITINGTESNILLERTGTDTLGFVIKNVLTNHASTWDSIICDKLRTKVVYEQDLEGIQSNNSNPTWVHVSVKISKLSSANLEGFKSWLASNPLTIIYQLVSPIVEEVPNFNIRSYKGKNMFLINTGVVQGEANYCVSNSVSDEFEILKDKIISLDGTCDNINNIIQNNILGSDDIFNINFIKSYPKKYFNNICYEKDLNNIRYNLIAYTTAGDSLLNLPTGENGGAGILEVIQIYTGVTVSNVLHRTIQRYTNSITANTYLRVYDPDKVLWTSWQKLTTASTLSLMEQQISELELQLLEKGV